MMERSIDFAKKKIESDKFIVDFKYAVQLLNCQNFIPFVVHFSSTILPAFKSSLTFKNRRH